MYVCSRERDRYEGGSCFGVSDPTELRPPMNVDDPMRSAKGFQREDVFEPDGVYRIGSVERTVGKFIARFHYERLQGEFDTKEAAIQAIRDEALRPLF